MTLARKSFFVQDGAGNVVAGAHVEVRSESTGALAALYSDRAGTMVLGNPFDSDSSGCVYFHVSGGAYQIRVYTGASGAPTSEQIFRYEGIGLNSEGDTAASTSINVKDYGALGDGASVTATVSITSGTAALTATGATFVSGDVGKRIVVPGAGAAGAILSTTISAFTDATHVTLGANAGTTLSAVSKVVEYGTDDTTAINSMITAINTTANLIYWPPGIYWCTTLSTVTSASTFFGAGQQSTFLKTYAATGNVLTFSGCGTVRDMAFSSAVVRTSGATINLTGNGCLLSNFYISQPYIGVTSSGVLNKLENGSVGFITSRAVSAGSGAIWNTGTIMECTNVNVGSSTAVNADMAEFGFRCTYGEIDLTQCYAFLVNHGLLVDPGAGQLVLGVNVKGCWFDTNITTAINIAPTNSTAIVQYVWVSDTWCAPGSSGASGFALVVNNAVNATLRKVFITNCYILSYTHGAGSGLYLDGGSTANTLEVLCSNTQIGGASQAFATGVTVQGNTKDWSISGCYIAFNTLGVSIAAGCDNFVLTDNRILNNTTAVTDSSTASANVSIVNNLGYVSSKNLLTSSVAAGSAVALTSAVAANITSISLPAGDWDLTGLAITNANGTTTTSLGIAWISTTSATQPTAPNNGSFAVQQVNLGAGANFSLPTGPIRISVAATTTVYLSIRLDFAVSTNSAYGFLRAAKVR